MNRTILTQQDLVTTPVFTPGNRPMGQEFAVADEVISQPDDWKTTLLKLVPAEVVGAYITIDGLLKGGALPPTDRLYQTIIWVVFLVLCLLNYFYLRPTIAKPRQLWLSVFAFPVWVFSLGGPFLYMGIPESTVHLIGSVALVLYTVSSVLFMKE